MGIQSYLIHAGPSQQSWSLFEKIKARAIDANMDFEIDSECKDSYVKPDAVISGPSNNSAVQSLLLAVDFTPWVVPNLPIWDLIEILKEKELPDPDTTRWFAASMAHAHSCGMRVIWKGERDLNLPLLGRIQMENDDSARPADPALGIYGNNNQSGGKAYWHPRLFSIGAASSTRKYADQWLDLSGKSKCISTSPRLSIPPGRWKIEWVFELDEVNGATDILFRWHENDDVFTFNVPGRYIVRQETSSESYFTPDAEIMTSRPHFHGFGRLVGALVTNLN